MKIEARIIPLTQSIGYIKDPGLCLESHPQTRTQETTVQIIARYIVLCPTRIQKCKEKRVKTHQVTVFQRSDSILRRENALFIESPQQPIATDKE